MGIGLATGWPGDSSKNLTQFFQMKGGGILSLKSKWKSQLSELEWQRKEDTWETK